MAKSSVTVPSYVKNVAKSFGYAISDAFGDFNPVIKSLTQESKEVAESIYDNIKSSTNKNSSEKSLFGVAKNTIDDAFKNIKDDLKTGNWYNKKRQDEAYNDIAKAMGFDMSDMGFDFNEDWGDDFSDLDLDTQATVATEVNNTKQLIGAMDIVGSQIASSVSQATAESASYIALSNRQSSKALYGLNQRGFNQVTQALMTVNNSIVSFAQIGESLTSHMNNSAVFYTRTTETLNKMDQSLQQIVKNTTPAPLSSDKKYSSNSKNTFSSILGDTGISIDAYKDMVKENFSEYKDLMAGALDMIKGSGSGGGSLSKNLSPMILATKWITNLFIPKIFKESMKNLNESLKYALTGGMVKLRDYNPSNFILSMLKDMFVPQDNFKTKLSTSNYEKGRISWDGVSRKALTEVIPEYLSKIYRAMTGIEEHYDYDMGKFVSRKYIEEKKKYRETSSAQRAGGDFRTDVIDSIGKMKMSESQKEKMKSEVEAYFYNSFMKGDGFYDIFDSNFKAENFGLSKESLDIIKNIVNNYRNSKDKDVRNRHNKFVSNVLTERDDYGNSMRRLEASGTSSDIYLYNNEPKFASKLGLDEYQHTSSFYLQGIYQYTGYLADNIDYISGKSKKAKKRKNLTKGGKIDQILNPTEEKETSTNASSESSTEETYNKFDFETDEEREMREKAEKNKRFGEEAKKRVDGIKGKIFSILGIMKPSNLKKAYNKPFEAAAGLLDSIGFSLDKLLWGKDENDPEQGIFNYIFTKMKDSFNKLNDFIDEKFGFNPKEKMKQFWDYLWGAKNPETGKREGGKFEDLRKETAQTFKDIGSSLGKTAKQFLFGDKYTDSIYGSKGRFNNGSAAYGRKVTKTGIVAVSEGELIVPSELNPYYNGITNKSKQIKDEQSAINKFYGAFANGGTIPREGSYIRKKKGKGYAYYQIINGQETLLTGQEKGKAKKYFEEQDRKEAEKAAKKEAFKSTLENGEGFIGKIYQSATKVGQDIKGKIDEFTANKKQEEKEKSIISDKTKEIFKEIGDSKGAIAAGSIIGAGVSVLTGSIVGPLFGAAIGGAVGLVAKSKTVQNILFGEIGEDGEREGGIISKKMSQAITKHVPSMGKGAAFGGAAGLFLGSPILGAVLGTTIGYVKSSEKAQEWLFGKKDENGNRMAGGVIPLEMQKKLKSSATKMGIGALAGMVFGPMGGLAGNIILGASLGYLTDTKKFSEYFFGKEGDAKDKGLLGLLREKIVDNLDNLFHNLGNAISGWGKKLIRGTGEKIKDFLTKKARAYVDGEATGPLGRLVGGVAHLGGKLVKGTVNVVGDRLYNMNARRARKNLSKGYNVYDRKLKRNMTAAERVNARGGTESIGNNDAFGNLDILMSQANSKEELQQLRDQLELIKDPDRVEKRSINESMKKFYSGIYNADNDFSSKKATKIGKLIENGKINEVRKMLSPEEYSKFESVIREAEKNVSDAKNIKLTKVADTKRKLEEKGIKLKGYGAVTTALDRLDEEMKSDKFGEVAVKEKTEKEFKTTMQLKVEEISKTLKNLYEYFTSEHKEKKKNKAKNKAWKAQQESEKSKTQSDGEEIVTTTDLLGNVHQHKVDEDGKVSEIYDSAVNDESKSKMQKFMDSINHLPLIGSAIGGIKGLFESLKDKLFGEKDDEKKGIFASLLSGIGSIGNNIMESFTSGRFLKGLLKNVVAPVLLYLGFTGKFDTFFEKLTGGAFGKGSKGDIITDKNTGKVITKNENGDYVDSDRNIVEDPNISVRKGSPDSFSDKLKENAARGILTNTKSVTSTVLKKTAPGKKIAETTKKVTTAVADDAARITMADDIAQGCSKLTKVLKKIPGLKKVAGCIDDMMAELAETATKKLASSTAKSILNFAANAVIFAKIAFAVVDFTTGYQDARSTFGITAEPSTGQKIISGLLRVVKNIIPIVGSLLPDSLIIDLFCKYIAPMLGMDISELKDQRAAAQKEVDEYNAANGTNYSVQEYNKAVLGDYTWTEKIGNGAKSAWSNVKKGAKKLGKGIAHTAKKIGKGAKNLWNKTKEGASNLWNKAKEGVSNIKEKVSEKFTEVKEGISEKGLIGFTVDDVKSKVSGIFDKFKNSSVGKNTESNKQKFDSSIEALKALAKEGKTSEVWKSKLEINKEGDILHPIWNVGFFFNKVIQTVVSVFHNIVGKVKDFISGIKEKVSGIIDGIKGFIEDPLGTIGKAKDKVVSGVKKAGSWIGDKVSGAFNAVKGWFSGSGSGLTAKTNNFVSQLDPRYKNMKFGDSTVGKKGCAPAVATMISNQYGKKLNMSKAVSRAANYSNQHGVTADYFSDVLNKQGIQTKYITGKHAPAELAYNLSNNQPLILLGRDAKNKSKDKSPFGPNGHYVIATGLDSRGNVIIYDPESDRPKIYNKSILGNTSIGIATSGAGTTEDTTATTTDSTATTEQSSGDALGSISSLFSSNLGNLFTKFDTITNSFSSAFGDLLSSFNLKNSTSGTTGTQVSARGYDNLYKSTIVTPEVSQSVTELMKSKVGKLQYSLGSVQDPDRGIASCASTVGWAYKKALGLDGMSASSTTQSKDNRFTTIYRNNGNNVIDPTKLQPGDIIYHNWNQTADNGKMQHTEMYMGDNKILSHGGGEDGKTRGPVWKDYNDYRKKHTMMVRRYTPWVEAQTSGQGSGLSTKTLLDYAPSQYVYGGSGTGLNVPKYNQSSSIRKYSGGDSNINTKTQAMLNEVKETVIKQGKDGTISADLVQKLIQAIIDVLEKIANNTAPVGQIYQALLANQATNATAATTAAKAATIAVTSNSTSKNDTVDSSIKNLYGTLATLLKG